jgi:drug/metabolite transporter (DMT)-like permease
MTSSVAAPRWLLVAALAAVYLIWGSTYLAIAIAVEGIPPLTSAGIRFVFAGFGLLLIFRLCGKPWPKPGTWISGAVVGVLMLSIGNGLVCVAERHVPSGLTALLLAITPIFVVSGTWWMGGPAPTRLAAFGMLLGLSGVTVLCAPGSLVAPWWAYATILIASLAWAAGLVVGPRFANVDGLLVRTAVQMACGGVVLLLVAPLSGERFPAVSSAPASWLAILYLSLFGSVVAYTAYVWLQGHASAALATSNAYVNPLVALALGSTLHGEGLDGRIGLGASLVIAAVALIAIGKPRLGRDLNGPTPVAQPATTVCGEAGHNSR